MNPPLWQLSDVRLGSQAKPRLQVPALDVLPGITAVLGESGAGKTSLLNLLVEFERADAGNIKRASQPVGNLAWVPADFGLWSPLSVREHLAVVVHSERLNREADVNAWLARFDLQALADQYPETLSMGERSRLAVARALATNTNVIVMDEPLVHVDSAHLSGYWQVIRDVVAERNATLIFSTHSPEVVLREANHVICLTNGRVNWQGDVENLYKHPPTEELARALGKTNWLEPKEANCWLDQHVTTPLNLRPEYLAVSSVTQGRFEVKQSRFSGTYTETELFDTNSNQQRAFIHLPSTQRLQPGDKVSLKSLLSCLLLLFSITMQGCQQSHGEETQLEITDVKHHTLPAEGAMLPAPRGLTYSPQGELFVLDNAGRMIVYDAKGNLSRTWWMPEYSVGKPEGAWVLLDGRVAVADTHYHRVLLFDQQGTLLDQFGENGRGEGQFIYVIAVTQDPHGFLYVAENGGNDRIQKFTASGEYVTTIGACGVGPGEFQRPSGVVWNDGQLFVADAINNRIQVFKDDGTFVKIIGDEAGLYYPYDIAQAPDGSLFVPEYGAGRISQLSNTGELLGRYGREGRGLGQFWTPWGLAVSSTGAVAIADTGNRRIVEMHLAQFKHLTPKKFERKTNEVHQ